MKLKDILNKRVNRSNKQISLDIKKRKMNSCKIDVEDILNIEIKPKKVKEIKFEDKFEIKWRR